jgi:hypothetical protein
VTDQGGNFLNAMQIWGSQGYFIDRMQEIDAWVEVDFDKIPYSIWIRPSHPNYRQALIRAAHEYRPMGAAVYVVKEVDVQESDPRYMELMPENPTMIRQWASFIRNLKYGKR